MILGVVSWTLNTLFLFGVTLLLYRRFRSGYYPVDAVVFLSLAIFLVTLFTLAFGLLAMLRPVPIGVASALGIVLIFIPTTRIGLKIIGREFTDAWKALRSFFSGLSSWLRIFTVIAIGAAALRFAFLIWALPPFVWDSMTYHLTNVAHWTQAGRIELFETPVIRIYTPANYEVLASWFTVFLHHDGLVEAAGLPVYALGVLAVYSGAKSLGTSRSSAWLAAMGYGSTPAVLLATTGTKNDPHMAAYYLAMLAILLELRSTSERSRRSNTLGLLIVLIFLLLLAAGTKAYVAHLIPGLAFIGILGLNGRPGLGVWRERWHSAVTSLKEAGTRLQVTIVVLLLSGIFLGGYWNLRNWALTGNPFFPYGVSIEGTQVFPKGDRTARLTTDRLTENLRMLADRFGDHKGPIVPDLPETTGWGWYFYAFGLPAAVWAVIRVRRFWVLFLGFSVSFLLLMLSTRPSPWNMRYAIWLPAVGSLAYALLAERLKQTPRALRVWFWSLTALALSLNFTMTLNYNRVSAGKFALMLDRPFWQREAGVLKLNMPSEYEAALLHVPSDQPLGYNVHGNGFVYPLYRSNFAQRLTYVSVEPTDSCGDIAERMKSHGTRYLFVAPGHTSEAVLTHLEDCTNGDQHLRRLTQGLYVTAPSD